jgi:hypothetical protein
VVVIALALSLPLKLVGESLFNPELAIVTYSNIILFDPRPLTLEKKKKRNKEPQLLESSRLIIAKSTKTHLLLRILPVSYTLQPYLQRDPRTHFENFFMAFARRTVRKQAERG